MKIQMFDEIKNYEIPELYTKEWGNNINKKNNETEILSVIFKRIGEKTLKDFPNLKCIVVRQDDVNHITSKCREKHITVCKIDIPEIRDNVVDWCFKHIRRFDNYKNLRYCIYGYGRIGHGLEYIMQKHPNCIEGTSAIDTDSDKDYIDSALKYSDVISIHMPYTKDMRKMFNTRMFSDMKKGVKIINTSSTSLIDIDALRKAVDDEIVDLYISDTMFWKDRQDLKSHGHYILSDKNAWFSPDIRHKMTEETIKTINSYIEGSPINVAIKGDKRWF